MMPDSLLRSTAKLEITLLMLVYSSLACSSSSPSEWNDREVPAESRQAASGLARRLWILNQSGDPALADFFSCVLAGTNWNDLANTYPSGESLVFGGQVLRNDNPCIGAVGSTAFYQCAVNAGRFNVTSSDVLLVTIPDSGYGGQNSSNTLVNPVNGSLNSIKTTYIRTSPDPIYQTIYGGHEVFEAQTDGVSADCCDGETASGGPFPWCPSCGIYANGTGACGRYAGGGSIGTLGIDTIECGARTFKYQRVSPFGNEFDGTCLAIAARPNSGSACVHVSSKNNGHYCGLSRQNGFNGGLSNTLYHCQDGQVASTQTCGAGCSVAPSGLPDSCNVDRCARVASRDNGEYCGASRQYGFGGGSSDTIYTCSGGITSRSRSCAKGCFVAAQGSPDGCVGNPCAHVPGSQNGFYCGSSTQSGFYGGAPNFLYSCANGTVSASKACGKGCNLAPAGQADSCK